MLRPSPNELDRLKKEELAKRRLIRLKEVREYSKSNASKLRNLYKEQKAKVIYKIAQTIQEEFNNDNKNILEQLKSKHAYQSNAIGQGHINASDWVDPSIAQKEQLDLNYEFAAERHNIAIKNLRDERREKKATELFRLRALQSALSIEKERAAEIAALPPVAVPSYLKTLVVNSDDIPRVKVCDRNKFSVIESFETAVYNVERPTDPENAKEAGERRQHELLQLSNHQTIQNEEQVIKANLRGHMAIKKQVVHKHYDELVCDLEMLAKTEMAEKQRNYHTSDGFGTNMSSSGGINEAMMVYKERCRERAVEGAVMESLKDITNEGARGQAVSTSGHNETALTRLYNQIRRQKENVPVEKSIEAESTASTSTSSTCRVSSATSEHIETVVPVQHHDNIRHDIIQHAMSVANKAETVLAIAHEARDKQPERVPIETGMASPISGALGHSPDTIMTVPVPPTVSPSQTWHDYSHKKLSLEVSKSLESLETNQSESVSRIREFQRAALLKLNGQLNTSEIRRLERQFSNVSIYSSTLTNQSTTKSVAEVQYNRDESHSNTSEDSKSHVKEWVNSQLLQTSEQLPDWVTRSDSHFMPDLNVSFRSSILNIKTVNNNREINLSTSTTTIDSSTSSLNIGVTPDLMETHVDHASNHNRSISSKENDLGSLSRLLMQDNSTIDIDNIISSSSNNLDSDLISSFNEEVEDLIDLHSNNSVSTLSDFTPYTVNLPEQMLSKGDTNYSKNLNLQISSNENIGDSEELFQKHSNSKSVYVEQNEIEAISSNDRSDHNPLVSNYENHGTENSKSLISDYEKFLDSIVFNDFSNSKNKMTLDVSESLGIVTQSLESLSTCCEELSDSENGNNISVIRKYPLDNEIEKDNHETQEKDLHISEIDTVISEIRYDSDIMENNEMTSVRHDKEDKSYSNRDFVVKNNSKIENPKSLTISSDNLISFSSNDKLKSLDVSNRNSPDTGSFSNIETFKPPLDYESDLSVSSVLIEEMVPLTSFHSTIDSIIDSENLSRKKMENILSSTLIPEKINRIPSPNVSSIHSDATLLLKQKIMSDYFETNKDYLQMILSSTNSSRLTLKPLDSSEEETPRIPDSGKASSRLTIENSGQSTARMTNDDIFVTPRNDSCWTEYSPHDELSVSNNIFRPLSEYFSSKGTCESDNKEFMEEDLEDLNETLKDFKDSKTDTDLIMFDSNCDLLKSIPFSVSDQAYIKCDENGLIGKSNTQDTTPTSQKVSTVSNILSAPGLGHLDEDLTLDTPSTDGTLSLKPLESFRSSVNSNLGALSAQEIQEFETNPNLQSPDCVDNNLDIDSKSPLDLSNLSLVSFCNNELNCQDLEKRATTETDNKKSTVTKPTIDSNEQMKIQLEKWKKDRLLRINKDPPKDNKKQVIKDSNMRSKEDADMKRRTMKLWNNLDEVQKINQQKNAEKLKSENQLRKKQYAEKLRRMKKEKQNQNTRKTDK